MRKAISHTVVAAMACVAMLGAVAPPAAAGGPEVIREGACSGRSDWKLKLKEDNGRIEVEFEVDQNVVGRLWRVRIRQDGVLVFSGRRRTQAPSGSFEVRLLERNTAGTDRFVARARSLAGGETCRAGAVWNA